MRAPTICDISRALAEGRVTPAEVEAQIPGLRMTQAGGFVSWIVTDTPDRLARDMANARKQARAKR